MTERQELLLLLGLLYLAECFRWVRRGSGVFRRVPGVGWTGPAGSGIVGNDHGDLHWTWPLLDFGDVRVARGVPWSVGPAGVATWHPATRHPQGRCLQDAVFHRWDALQPIELDGDRIFVANQPFWLADSQVEAQRLAGLLKRWSELSADARAAAIGAEVRDSFDVAAVRERLAATDPALRGLRHAGAALWVILFLVMPLSIWRFGWMPALPAGLVAAYGLGIWMALRAAGLHAAWYPRATAERVRLRWLAACSPLSALRAVDLVGRNRLEAFDPLAVALALLPARAAATVATAWVRDAAFPRLPENPFPAGSDAAATVNAFAVEYRVAGEALLTRQGLDPVAARRAPVASEPAHARYCPRCHAQFLSVATTCQACGGRPLQDLTPTEPHSPASSAA